MVGLPVHPRLARMIVGRPDTLSCIVAAVVDERDIVRTSRDRAPADLALRVGRSPGAAATTVPTGGPRRVRERAADIARRAGIRFDPDVRRPRRRRRGAARRVPRPPRRRGGGPASSSCATARERGSPTTTRWRRRRSSSPPTSTASAREPASASAPPSTQSTIAALLDGVVEDRRLEWDADADDLVERVERRLDALRLGDERRRPAPGDDTTAALVARVRATRLAVLPWRPATEQLRARVAFLRARRSATPGPTCPTGRCWRRSTSGCRRTSSAPPAGPTSTASTSPCSCAPSCRGRSAPSSTSWPRRRGALPTGREAPIDYAAERPTVSVRVQDVFGVTVHPTVAGGRVPLTLALLSPADRPIQVTADLPGFWSGSWADVRKDLAGRYPKHRWPDDPGHADPGRLKDR